jgi:hypothetical protein
VSGLFFCLFAIKGIASLFNRTMVQMHQLNLTSDKGIVNNKIRRETKTRTTSSTTKLGD